MPELTMSDDLTEFERDLLESVRQAKAGSLQRFMRPSMMTARRRGRPVESVSVTRKASTTIRLDDDVMSAFRAAGAGWQTRINAALREAVQAGRV